MQKEIERQAGKVVSLVKYEVGHPDYRGELQRLFASGPEGVVAVSWSEMARIQHKQAFEMGLTETVKGAWYVPYPWDVIGEAIPETVEGIKGLDYGFGTPRTAQFLERFERRNPGVEVVSDAIRAYDACWVAALAMGISGSTEPDNILKVLPFVFSMYKGASSSDLGVDEDGMQKTQVYFAWIARNGKLVRYTDEVIGAR